MEASAFSVSEEYDLILGCLLRMQRTLRKQVWDQLTRPDAISLSGVSSEEASDTIYLMDRSCDGLLISSMEELAEKIPFLLIAEGVSEGGPLPFPKGNHPEDCRYSIILDPIDGTRMLMYDKRSAWTLAGVAPNRGDLTNLADIELAVMTELPFSKQCSSDTLWAVAGKGVSGWRENLLEGTRRKWTPNPSRARDLDHGFAQLTKFFHGRKSLSSEIEESLLARLGAFDRADRCLVFDDQYLSTGGQIYELIAGHDRFQADIRAALRRLDGAPGHPPGMACHPYDICVELIAREAGVPITDLHGERLSAPLDTTTEVDWVGYANSDLQALIAPMLAEVLGEYGLAKQRSKE